MLHMYFVALFKTHVACNKLNTLLSHTYIHTYTYKKGKYGNLSRYIVTQCCFNRLLTFCIHFVVHIKWTSWTSCKRRRTVGRAWAFIYYTAGITVTHASSPSSKYAFNLVTHTHTYPMNFCVWKM